MVKLNGAVTTFDGGVHKLKSCRENFEPIWSKGKFWDYRRNDRQFQLGDRVHLREWSRETGCHTGRELWFGVMGISECRDRPGYVLLSFGVDRVLVALNAAKENSDAGNIES